MQAGLIGLGVWSFLMATAHGAGLMLWPALMPPAGATPDQAVATALAGIAVHTLAMLTVTAAIAILVYEWIGLEVLRHAWINVDVIWIAALIDRRLAAGGLNELITRAARARRAPATRAAARRSAASRPRRCGRSCRRPAGG